MMNGDREPRRNPRAAVTFDGDQLAEQDSDFQVGGHLHGLSLLSVLGERFAGHFGDR
jgi:hypothetical protein